MGGLLVFMLNLLASFLIAITVVEAIKECTNTPTPLSSHTVRYELLNSKNSSWREEVFNHYYHLNPTEESLWANLLPRKMLQEQRHLDWAMLYRTMKHSGGAKLAGGGGSKPNFLREVSLHDVRLHVDSPQGQAQQTNLEYLLMLDVDNLLWSFRETAGLPTPGSPYGGWESSDQELRGHFVGHYLSATSQMWASTHNETLSDKMSAIVNGLNECQKKIGTGYLSAFPAEFFDRFEAIQPVWAPYYTIHKILAGLLDQYTLAGNDQALKMATWMTDYFSSRVQNVILKYSIERHWESINEETGGMNDVLYRLYAVTGEEKHLVLAHLFDKPCFLGLLAVKADSLSGFHSNTHIPVVIGSQMRYEVTGDPLYKEISTFFLDILNTSHTYATGGTSSSEFWDDPKRLASTLQTENEESCTTYNVLKVARNLFRWTKDIDYADHYERAILNGVLSIQRGREPGVMIYMLPLGHGVSKAKSYHGWGTKFNSFWCCYGTAIESFSKLGDSIYFEEDESSPKLYIIQFVSSSVDWKSGQVLINQTVDPVVSWDPFLRVTLTISPAEGVGPTESTLNVRIPSWTHSNGAVAMLNDDNLPLPSPGNFLSVMGTWKSGDKLTLKLPLSLRTENIKDDRPEYSSLQAILYGPFLLAGHSDGDSDIVTGSVESLSDWIFPVPAAYGSQLISLSQESKDETLVLIHSKDSFSMASKPEPGTYSSVHATYRLVSGNSSVRVSSREDIIGKLVMLELFDQPESFIVEQGTNKNLIVNRRGADDWDEASATFQILSGLDGKDNTISFQSRAKRGCFISASENVKAGSSVQLACRPGKRSSNGGFQAAISFAYNKGISEYNPISFVVKGAKRNFLLEPLLSLRDEFYNVYFNINS